MIVITLHPPQGKRWDRRGRLFDATARLGDLRFEVAGAHAPVVAALRAVIAGTPGFADAPWQLVRDGRVALFGPSARQAAAERVGGGGRCRE